MPPLTRFLLSLVASALLAGCSAQSNFQKTPETGTFSGEPRMVSIAPNTFFFYQEPSEQKFTFKTHHDNTRRRLNGRDAFRYPNLIIEPEEMITTGANVPRNLWFMPGFGAFDFTRAAIIHDWLFEAHHRYSMAKYNLDAAEKLKDQKAIERNRRDEEAYRKYKCMTQDDAADIFAECIRATMFQSESILKDLKKLPADQVKTNGLLREDNLKDLKQALKISSSRPRTLWAYHYFVSKRCVVNKSRRIWDRKETDIDIYRMLAGPAVRTIAQQKGYMSEWLIGRFQTILDREERRHRDYKNAKKLNSVAQSNTTTPDSETPAEASGEAR